MENAGNSAILVHAGLSPQVKNLNLTYDQINDYGRLGMDDNCPGGNAACQVVNGGSDEGVYWYRGIANQELSQSVVEDIISSFNGETMIFGHTVFPQVTALYEQKVMVVDVDHGDNFEDGFMEALYIQNGCYFRLVTSPNSSGFNLSPFNPDCISVNTSELLDIAEIDIAPNLFRDELTIQYSSNVLEGKVMIHDIFGNLIDSFQMRSNQNNISINTSHWTQGTYVIALQYKDQISSKKAIKY